MKYLLDLLSLAVVVVFIIDVSGAAASFRQWLNGRLGRPEDAPVPPFDCSLCATWWAGIAFSLFSGITLPRIAAVALVAALARPLGEMLFIVRDALEHLINALSSWIEKQ